MMRQAAVVFASGGVHSASSTDAGVYEQQAGVLAGLIRRFGGTPPAVGSFRDLRALPPAGATGAATIDVGAPSGTRRELLELVDRERVAA